MHSPPDEYALDSRALRRIFDRASGSYTEHAIVHAEIRSRLVERLDVVKLQPKRVLDLGAASGGSTRALKNRYPKAHVVALDLSARMLEQAARAQSLLRRFDRIAADAQRIPLRDASVDLVFSNLMLAWCNDVDSVFREAARVLATDGLFVFTSLGPDTLREIRDAFRHVDSHVHVHRFIDMHDLGDALMRLGFAEPVMDTERLIVTYPTAAALFEELRRTGSTNIAAGRRKGLLGRTAFRGAERVIESRRGPNAISISIEVVYGHAWKATRGTRTPAHNEVRIPIDRLRKGIPRST